MPMHNSFMPARMALALGLLFVCLMWAPPVNAGEPSDIERAKALFKKAELHFKLGEFKQALPLYKEAYRTKPLAGFLFNLGQCHRYLNECGQANFFFRQFITAKPDSPFVPEVKRLMETCKPSPAQAPVVAPKPVVEKDPPPSAPPVVEKDPPPSAPPAVVQKPVVVKNPPPSAPPAIVKTPPPSAPPAVVKKPEAPKTEPPAEETPEPVASNKTRKALLWGGMGLTTAMLVTGAITGGMAYDKSETFKDPATPYEDLDGLESSGKTMRAVAIATLSVAGAAAVGTALVYFLYPKSTEAPAVSLAPLPSGGAITVVGRF